jgi:magnesium-protoporphyrin O-methyltransferase
MSCQCQGIESYFSSRTAGHQLRRYRRKGPRKTTRLLLDALRKLGVEGKTLLDIGGGVGVIQHELFQNGLQSATQIDASSAYTHSAQAEAARRGNAGRTAFRHGDFVDMAGGIPKHQLVTLDRVICCYHDADALLEASAGLTLEYYAVVLPRENRLAKLAFGAGNLYLKMTGSEFRGYVHNTGRIEEKLRRKGFEQIHLQYTLMWQVAVYRFRNRIETGSPAADKQISPSTDD